MKKLFQKLFGKKQSFEPTNAEAKRVLAKDMESKRAIESEKKQGDHIPRFNPSNPDPELIDLANTFSYGYKTSPDGHYLSGGKMYRIQYCDLLQNAVGLPTRIIARAGVATGILEFSRKVLLSSDKITSDFVFWLVIWGVVRRSQDSDYYADEVTTRYYLTTTRSVKNLATGFLVMAGNENIEYNTGRYAKIVALLKTQGVW